MNSNKAKMEVSNLISIPTLMGLLKVSYMLFSTMGSAPPGAPETSLDTRKRLRGFPHLEVGFGSLIPSCARAEGVQGMLLMESLHKVHSEDEQTVLQ